jgi:hypothetical protein
MKKINEKEKVDLERKYEYKLKETQNYFEKMLKSKMLEMEENTAIFYEKMKEEGQEFEKRIHQYEENYVSLH